MFLRVLREIVVAPANPNAHGGVDQEPQIAGLAACVTKMLSTLANSIVSLRAVPRSTDLKHNHSLFIENATRMSSVTFRLTSPKCQLRRRSGESLQPNVARQFNPRFARCSPDGNAFPPKIGPGLTREARPLLFLQSTYAAARRPETAQGPGPAGQALPETQPPREPPFREPPSPSSGTIP